MDTYNYYNFIKQMKSEGYTWDEIEYYWRHPEELDDEDDYLLTEEQQKEKAYWEYIGNI